MAGTSRGDLTGGCGRETGNESAHDVSPRVAARSDEEIAENLESRDATVNGLLTEAARRLREREADIRSTRQSERDACALVALKHGAEEVAAAIRERDGEANDRSQS